MEFIGTQNNPVSQRRSVRRLVSSSLKVPIEKRVKNIRTAIKENKVLRRRDRDEPHEMVYHPRKIMKL